MSVRELRGIQAQLSVWIVEIILNREWYMEGFHCALKVTTDYETSFLAEDLSWQETPY